MSRRFNSFPITLFVTTRNHILITPSHPPVPEAELAVLKLEQAEAERRSTEFLEELLKRRFDGEAAVRIV